MNKEHEDLYEAPETIILEVTTAFSILQTSDYHYGDLDETDVMSVMSAQESVL